MSADTTGIVAENESAGRNAALVPSEIASPHECPEPAGDTSCAEVHANVSVDVMMLSSHAMKAFA